MKITEYFEKYFEKRERNWSPDRQKTAKISSEREGPDSAREQGGGQKAMGRSEAQRRK